MLSVGKTGQPPTCGPAPGDEAGLGVEVEVIVRVEVGVRVAVRVLV